MLQGEKRVMFDVSRDGQKIAPKYVPPEEEQEPNESRRCVHRISMIIRILTDSQRRLWSRLTSAIVAKDMEAATEAKTAVEETQRELRRLREESGQTHTPRFFAQNKEGRWIPKFTCVCPASTSESDGLMRFSLSIPTDPVQAEIAVQSWIWSTGEGAGMTMTMTMSSRTVRRTMRIGLWRTSMWVHSLYDHQ